MEANVQMMFKNNLKYYEYLKRNSYYIKEINRGNIDYKTFVNDMKVKYKERTSDKISNMIDNIDIISSVIETLK